jgi:hypothetical protein
MTGIFFLNNAQYIWCYFYVTGGVEKVMLTPELFMSVRGARAAYQEYLDSEKIKKDKEAVAAVKKRKSEELTALKEKRRRLEIDCASMEADADNLAQQAENTSKLTLLAKSNALRRGAKSKRDEITKLDADIVASHSNN